MKRYGTREERIRKFLSSLPMIISFFSKIAVRSTNCWEWTASTRSGSGYGQFGIDGYGEYAHRLMWVLFNGAIPSGMYLCHTCDNRKCVNPDHLFVGTQKDNMSDCKEKGRNSFGENHPKSILTQNDIISMSIDRNSGFSWKRLSDKYHTPISTIRSAIAGKNWKHLRVVRGETK